MGIATLDGRLQGQRRLSSMGVPQMDIRAPGRPLGGQYGRAWSTGPRSGRAHNLPQDLI